jgi:hypothetical protein
MKREPADAVAMAGRLLLLERLFLGSKGRAPESACCLCGCAVQERLVAQQAAAGCARARPAAALRGLRDPVFVHLGPGEADAEFIWALEELA